jgi:hypothetical protein
MAVPAAYGASSASFQIPNGVVDTAGGTSASANYLVTGCVGSEIAGTSTSTNFRIDSGCGPSALSLAGDLPFVISVPQAPPKEIPAVSGLGMAILAVALAAMAMSRLRVPRR